MSWDIVLNKGSMTSKQLAAAKGDAIDIDLFDNTDDGQTTIKDLAAAGKKVICYFSAGSREDWRDDANQFVWPVDYGKNMTGSEPGETWEGENWVNVTSPKVRSIMKARIELAAKSGCHAIDPDNVDGFSSNHQDGYTFPQSAYSDYVNYLADIARQNNLAMGLKNAMDLIPAVLPNISFAVNEQCHEFGECGKYKDMTTAGLAVFNIEYKVKNCTQPAGVVLSGIFKTLALDKLGGQC
ncbi:glycoside hydrolase superfamily [Lophiotrema nucula]|uniref:alpha-galactosidase n=1 Tax=Lophiotrema nucula TaxID=690887 RepID=A0A6A5ZQR1_9PLEO|nr:glycoside hydrolase superfamily [Lophiotrema nucula]